MAIYLATSTPWPSSLNTTFRKKLAKQKRKEKKASKKSNSTKKNKRKKEKHHRNNDESSSSSAEDLEDSDSDHHSEESSMYILFLSNSLDGKFLVTSVWTKICQSCSLTEWDWLSRIRVLISVWQKILELSKWGLMTPSNFCRCEHTLQVCFLFYKFQKMVFYLTARNVWKFKPAVLVSNSLVRFSQFPILGKIF